MKPFVIIFVVGSFVNARVSVHPSLGINEQIGAASGRLPASWQLWLGVALLLVIIVLQLQVRRTRRPHWSNILVFIG